jgi:hypothetical protein
MFLRSFDLPHGTSVFRAYMTTGCRSQRQDGAAADTNPACQGLHNALFLP